jgi:DNA invertase Pin-like site-specific DNA recombinase
MSLAYNLPVAESYDEQLYALLYARISLERDRNRVAVGDQVADEEALCVAMGWQILDRYVDRDISAARDAREQLKERPEFNRLIERLLTEDRPVVIVCTRTDRLWRDHVDQTLTLVAGRKGSLRLVASTTGERVDPHNAGDEFVQDVLTASAKYEVKLKSIRTKGRLVHKAERGEYHGGKRAWGYEHDEVVPILDPDTGEQAVTRKTGQPRFVRRGPLVVVPDEKAQILEAKDRLLAGESTRSIVMDWGRRGILTPSGVPWKVTTLADAIVAPRLAGLRLHSGYGTYPATEWEPILTVEDHERLVALFDKRRTGRRASTARTHLLTGLLRCGKPRADGTLCGCAMQSSHVRGIPVYKCQPKGAGGCGGTSVNAERAEQAVIDKFFIYLDSTALARAIARQRKAAAKADDTITKLIDEISAYRQRLLEYEEDRNSGVMDRTSFNRMSAELRERIDDREKRVTRLQSSSGPTVVWHGRGKELAAGWAKMHFEERRQLLFAFAESFVVDPHVGPRSEWNPDRIRPVWLFQ